MAEEPHCSRAALCAVIIPSLHCKLPSPITPNNGSARFPKWKSELWRDCQRGEFPSSAFGTESCLSESQQPASSPDTHSHVNHRLSLTELISFLGFTFFPSFLATHTSLFPLRDLLPTHQPTHTYTGRSPLFPPPSSPPPPYLLSHSVVRLVIDKGSLQILLRPLPLHRKY